MPDTKKKIWCLFTVANEYDQPSNNLAAWWQEKPSIEKLAAFMEFPLDRATDEQIVQIVGIWSGTDTQIAARNDTSYRLEEVEEGGVS